MQPVILIQQLYAAFARGDIPALLAALAPEVDWGANVDFRLPGAPDVPCYEPGRGTEYVAAYFARLARGYEVHDFDIRSMLGGGDEVAVRIVIDFTVRSTGRRIRSEAIHHWTLRPDGKVVRFRDFEDTLAFVHAWSAAPA